MLSHRLKSGPAKRGQDEPSRAKDFAVTRAVARLEAVGSLVANAFEYLPHGEQSGTRISGAALPDRVERPLGRLLLETLMGVCQDSFQGGIELKEVIHGREAKNRADDVDVEGTNHREHTAMFVGTLHSIRQLE
jgi:hypothetical protein